MQESGISVGCHRWLEVIGMTERERAGEWEGVLLWDGNAGDGEMPTGPTMVCDRRRRPPC